MNLTVLDFWELWLPIFSCRTLRLWYTSHSSIWTFWNTTWTSICY